MVISNIDSKNKTINEEKIINKAKKFLKRYRLKDTVDLILESEKLIEKNLSNMFKN